MTPNGLRLIAGDLSSANGHSPVTAALLLAADEIESLRAELTSAEEMLREQAQTICDLLKPDCRTCSKASFLDSEMECWSGFTCVGGDRYDPAQPLRLYEKEGA